MTFLSRQIKRAAMMANPENHGVVMTKEKRTKTLWEKSKKDRYENDSVSSDPYEDKHLLFYILPHK